MATGDEGEDDLGVRPGPRPSPLWRLYSEGELRAIYSRLEGGVEKVAYLSSHPDRLPSWKKYMKGSKAI